MSSQPPPTSPSATDLIGELVTLLCQQLQSSTSSTSLPISNPMAAPNYYSGLVEECNSFLLQCELFSRYTRKFGLVSARVVFIISHLTGKALNWAQWVWNAGGPLVQSKRLFVRMFQVFGQSASLMTAQDQLLHLRQARSSVVDYVLRFRTLAANNGWNEATLIAVFRQGLNTSVRAQMIIYDDDEGQENLIQGSVRISQHLSTYDPPKPIALPPSQPAPTPPAPEPMQLGRYHLTRNKLLEKLFEEI